MILENVIFLDDILNRIHFKGNVKGRVHVPIVGFCDDFYIQENFLTWCTSPGSLNCLLRKNTPMVIITTCEHFNNLPENVTVVPTENALKLFDRCVNVIYRSHERSFEKGVNCSIHKSVVIGKNVVIGNNCNIGPNVVIGDNSVIGDNVKIDANSVIGSFPFSNYPGNGGYERQAFGGVVIGANTRIGSCTTVDKGFTINTQVGEDCKIGNLVEIAHDVVIGKHCFICAQVAIAGNVIIEDNCYLWARSGIINRIHVAESTTLYANSIITKDSKKGEHLCGFPAMDKDKYWRQQAKLRIFGIICKK